MQCNNLLLFNHSFIVLLLTCLSFLLTSLLNSCYINYLLFKNAKLKVFDRVLLGVMQFKQSSSMHANKCTIVFQLTSSECASAKKTDMQFKCDQTFQKLLFSNTNENFHQTIQKAMHLHSIYV